MTVTGDDPRDGDAITEDEAWPDDGGDLGPPPEITEPEFDDEGSGGEHSQQE